MKIYRLFLTLMLFLSPFISLATSPSESSSETPDVVILHEDKKTTGRPNAPSRNMIECRYSTGHIEFKLMSGMQTLTVEIIDPADNDILWSGMVTSEDPAATLPDLAGELNIECIADNGKKFTGTLYF